MSYSLVINSLFGVGVVGLYFNRRHVIVILIALEIIFLSINLNLIYFTTIVGSNLGFVYMLSILTIAAAEAAVGLSLVVLFYRVRGGISVDLLTLLKG